MSLFRWVLAATVLTVTTTTAPAESRVPQLTRAGAEQQEAEPRVEIGEAVLTVFDESGRPVSVE